MDLLQSLHNWDNLAVAIRPKLNGDIYKTNLIKEHQYITTMTSHPTMVLLTNGKSGLTTIAVPDNKRS
jgi:hypothetical protein